MADSTTNLDQLAASQASKEVRINEMDDASSPATVYGRRASTCSGATWGYYGGRWGGNSVANGTLSLSSSNTHYIVALRSSGAVSSSTATTNWNNTSLYARLYKVVTGSGVVSSYEDHRAGPGGSAGGMAVVNARQVSIMAAQMAPSVSGGCAALAGVATTANRPDIRTLDFDQTTEEYAQFSVPMPTSWDEGTITARFIWSHAAGATAYGTVWALQGVAVSDDDTIDVAYGSAQTVTDTGGTANDLYISPTTSAITIGGTPAAGDTVFFRVYRVSANGSDTLDADARLHAVVLLININESADT